MREIKFRAWFHGINVMGQVTNLKGSNDGYKFDGVVAECFINGKQVFYEVYKSFTLMQFTGLRDKHGKEIWEGDVLNVIDCELVGYNQNEYGESEIYADSKGKVHYVGGGFCFDGHSAGDLPLDTFDSDALEVIGNIYENPELVGGSK